MKIRTLKKITKEEIELLVKECFDGELVRVIRRSVNGGNIDPVVMYKTYGEAEQALFRDDYQMTSNPLLGIMYSKNMGSFTHHVEIVTMIFPKKVN